MEFPDKMSVVRAMRIPAKNRPRKAPAGRIRFLVSWSLTLAALAACSLGSATAGGFTQTAEQPAVSPSANDGTTPATGAPALNASSQTPPTKTLPAAETVAPTMTPTPAPTWYPTLDAFFLKNVPDKGILAAITIYDDTLRADATLTGVYGGIRDGGTAYGKLEYFYPHTGAIMLWREGVTRCTSAVNAYPTGIERVNLHDVTALEITAESGTCGGRNLVEVRPDGSRITRAIVSRTTANGKAWLYGDISSNDDLILYVAYGPVAIPLASVRRIALLPLAPD
jgi:hypothetical protein